MTRAKSLLFLATLSGVALYVRSDASPPRSRRSLHLATAAIGITLLGIVLWLRTAREDHSVNRRLLVLEITGAAMVAAAAAAGAASLDALAEAEAQRERAAQKRRVGDSPWLLD